MSDLVECIPNVSEGRDIEVIDVLSDTVVGIKGVELLHRDVGYDANRTVFTFVGTSDSVIEAAYQLIKKAHELIDMRQHKGNHPRIGAVDVCPFVVINGIKETDLINKVNEMSLRLSGELNIPIFLYEKSAVQKNRKLLADIRKGEYEELAKKLQQEEWQPDFGSRDFNARFGALVMGVRDFLIAYNINIKGKDLPTVKKIAAQIRERGNFVLNKKFPSRLKGVRAIGWQVEKFDCLQVSTNITDFELTGIHEVFEAVKTLAESQGKEAAGSELIGLIPQQALIDSGTFYMEKKESSDLKLMRLAVKKLGLDTFQPFNLDERVLELLVNTH